MVRLDTAETLTSRGVALVFEVEDICEATSLVQQLSLSLSIVLRMKSTVLILLVLSASVTGSCHSTKCS
jgi:hypothetical protein